MVADLTLLGAAWMGAWYLRFHTDVPQALELPLESGNGDVQLYLVAMGGILAMALTTFRSRGLYEPLRGASLLREVSALVAGLTFTLVVALAVDGALRANLSRTVFGMFFGLGLFSVVSFRLLGRAMLRRLRRRGYNLRYALVVGAGELARSTIESIHGHPEAGLRVIGMLSNDPSLHGRTIQGVRVMGEYAAVKSVLESRQVDQVVIALPREDGELLEKILSDLDDEMVTVRLIPDLLHVMTLRSSVEELDGLPVINLRESPMVGWAAFQKRAFDLVVTSVMLLGALPMMGLLALLVWATSGRPIFYTQERMGLDGRVFRCRKFRSMRTDAEAEGPAWSADDDPRRTRLGVFMRRTNLDELPQLFSVLKGEMSLVGPRPERPVFIERFRREIPGYMLRHKVKAGCTGWAQIHGWRGNTSLHERVEHDIYYIQNWSLALDIRILAMSLWRGFQNAG